jgi:hypothetical protein
MDRESSAHLGPNARPNGQACAARPLPDSREEDSWPTHLGADRVAKVTGSRLANRRRFFFIDNKSARDNLIGASRQSTISIHLIFSTGDPIVFHQYKHGSRVSRVCLTLETTLPGSRSQEWQESGRKQIGRAPPPLAGGSIASWQRQSELIIPWQTKPSVKHDERERGKPLLTWIVPVCCLFVCFVFVW